MGKSFIRALAVLACVAAVAFGARPASAAERVYDLKQDGDFVFEALGRQGVRVTDRRRGTRAVIGIQALALEIAYGRLYVGQGSRGVKSLDLAEAKAFRDGARIQYIERVLGVHAFGIAVDERRQVLFLSGNQSPGGRNTGAGVTAWHFPDPRRLEVPIHPLTPIAFYPVLGAGAMDYDAESGALLVAAGARGIARLTFDLSREGDPRVEYHGNALPRPEDPVDWSGVSVLPGGEAQLVGQRRSAGHAVVEARTTTVERLARMAALRAEANRLEEERWLARADTRWKVFLAKFGQGFFTFLPIAHYGEALYASEMNEMLEEGMIGAREHQRLRDSVRSLEAVSRAGGTIASTLLVLYASGGLSSVAAARAALQQGGARGVIGAFPALIRMLGGPGQLGRVALDIGVGDALTVALDVWAKRPPELIVRDLFFNTVYSAVISYAGLSPTLSRMEKVRILAANAVLTSHLTVNFQGGDARDYNSFMAYNVSFAAVPFLPWTSVTRYEAVNRVLGWLKANQPRLGGSSALPALGRLLANERVTTATILGANQLFGAYAYVLGDQIMRYHVYPDGRVEERREGGPFRVNFRGEGKLASPPAAARAPSRPRSGPLAEAPAPRARSTGSRS